jgi:hypothetical protein
MRITRDSVAFVSEKGKDSFDMKYFECSFALDDDQLTIKAVSKVFRLKSAAVESL